MRIILVCTGNTCRSPMAEALLRRALDERGIQDIEVSSAGVFAQPGSPASDEAVGEMRKRGLDIRGHRSKHIRLVDTKGALLLCMTRSHLAALREIDPTADAYTLTDYAGHAGDIHDPIGRGPVAYKQAADQIQAAAESIANNISRGELAHV